MITAPAPTTHSWAPLLTGTRTWNRTRPGRYDWRGYYRGRAYLEHDGEEEPVVRAHGFASVLRHVPLHVYPDEMIGGSRAGFAQDTFPDGVDDTNWQRCVQACQERGQRHFQANWDHSVADFRTLVPEGVPARLARVRERLHAAEDDDQRSALEAMAICLEGLIAYAVRLSAVERQAGNNACADALDALTHRAPESFHEGLQLVWLVHMAFVSEDRYHMAVGRMDQYLWPLYRRDREHGMSRERALELVCHLWAHIEELGEVTNICVGGLTPEGDDGSNELSGVMIEATRLVQSPHTNLSARFHDGTPEWFHRACFECIRTGVGFPAIFNDHVLIPGLIRIGIPAEAARDTCMVGCIETMISGRQRAWSDCFFNAPAVLEETFHRLRGCAPDWPRIQNTFVELLQERLNTFLDSMDEIATSRPSERYPDPFLSALTRDCIGRGRDINAGGAEFERFFGVAMLGIGTMSDSLAAVKKLVIEEQRLEYDTLLDALAADFKGYESLRQMLIHHAPKYGNGDAFVDSIAVWLVDVMGEAVLQRPVKGGGRYVGAIASNVTNIPAGRGVGALPDGRHAGEPLSDAGSPAHGRDINGPTAVIESVSKPDYSQMLTGSVINMRFDPALFAEEEGARRFSALTHAFVRGRVPELQFNVTSTATLEEARRDPDRFQDLVVRVSGFSAYYTRLTPEIQQDIINRRAHA